MSLLCQIILYWQCAHMKRCMVPLKINICHKDIEYCGEYSCIKHFIEGFTDLWEMKKSFHQTEAGVNKSRCNQWEIVRFSPQARLCDENPGWPYCRPIITILLSPIIFPWFWTFPHHNKCEIWHILCRLLISAMVEIQNGL